MARVASVLLLLAGVRALQIQTENSQTTRGWCNPGTGCGRHLEKLVNAGDGLSYDGAAIVGNSYVDKVVWDTGSDEMVCVTDNTFSPLTPCLGGFRAGEFGGCYVTSVDTCGTNTHKLTPIMYGSGGALMNEWKTEVMLNDGECPIMQTVQEIKVTPIDLVLDGEINCIGGMDPNGHNFANVKQFSVCMGMYQTDSDATWVWNDYPAKMNPLFSDFTCLKILHPEDPFYWAIKATSVSIAGEAVGCPSGCAAIIDTGTSFFSLTHKQTDALEVYLKDVDCDEAAVAALDPIKVVIGGKSMSILPEDYIRFEYFGPGSFQDGSNNVKEEFVPDWLKEHTEYWRNRFPNMKLIQKAQAGMKQCYLAIAPPMADCESEECDTTLLLGDSFMRGHYWTFDREAQTVCNADLSDTSFVEAAMLKEEGSEKKYLKLSQTEQEEATGSFACQTTLVGSGSLFQDDKLIEMKKKNKQTAGANPESMKIQFVDPHNTELVRVKPQRKMRRWFPSKIMLGDAYHMFKRHGSFAKVHKAKRLRREALKNGGNATDLMHTEM